MARKNETPVFRKRQKVAAPVTCRACPPGTPGRGGADRRLLVGALPGGLRQRRRAGHALTPRT